MKKRFEEYIDQLTKGKNPAKVRIVMEGIERRSLRDHIFREVASNMLIHREYASGATSRLIIEYGRVVTDNPSRPHGFGLLNPETMIPYQKNPILSAFFREIDRADELGSGMRKMMLYGKKYGGADPQLIEGDSFRMIVSVPEFGKNPDSSPIICLGIAFDNDDARRAHFTEELQDLKFRKIEGFPIDRDEDILNLSDPPYYTACPNPWIADFIRFWEAEKSAIHRTED